MNKIRKQYVYLVRHGQSIWNHDSKFTGWTDIPLTNKGKHEAKIISNKLIENKIFPNIFFSSVLKRSFDSASIIKSNFEKELKRDDLKLYTSWRLNEKHYGTLEGIPRDFIRNQYGEKFTHMMRNNFYMKPPVLKEIVNNNHNYSIYRNCYYKTKKNGESKQDVLERLLPYYENDILYTLTIPKVPLIITHKHCSRVLMKKLLKISDDDFENFNIPSKTIIELEYENENFHKHRYIDYSL